MAHTTRRQFMQTAAAAGAAFAAGPAEAQSDTIPLCIFSKHLQFISDWDELAETYKALGYDGCDLTVRRGGHIEPDAAAVELPKAAAAFDRAGLAFPMITTNLGRGQDVDPNPLLAAASAVGVRYFRCGGHSYNDQDPIPQQLDGWAEELKGLAAAAETHGMVGGYHNHSGHNQAGGPLWDTFRLYESVGSPAIGANFDLGHASVEGSFGAWEINARLLAPHVKMVAAKDYVWDGGDGPKWVRLGAGRTKMAEMLRIFRDAGWRGPVSIHFEYDAGGRDALLDDMRASADVMREALADAGYAL